MTLNESIVYNIIVEVYSTKTMRRQWPTHALIIQDKVRSRAIESMTVEDYNRAVTSLIANCKIVSGPTINDTYLALVNPESL